MHQYAVNLKDTTYLYILSEMIFKFKFSFDNLKRLGVCITTTFNSGIYTSENSILFQISLLQKSATYKFQ